tara:strand:+ start:152 stop:310 length:159 start_codon:yes stop_codon:yes gene_type:complete
MAQAQKEVKKRVNKKVLLRELAEVTGRPLFHFDSLGRSNVETIQWVLEMAKN